MSWSPVATAQAVTTPAERQLGVAVLDIGGGTTDIEVDGGRGSLLHGVSSGWWAPGYSGCGCGHAGPPHEAAETLKIQSGAALADLVPESEFVNVDVAGETAPVPCERQFLASVIEARMEEVFTLSREEMVRAGVPQACAGGTDPHGRGQPASGHHRTGAARL